MHTHLANFLDILDKLKNLKLKIYRGLVAIFMLYTLYTLYSVVENYEPFRVAIETREKLPIAEELIKVKLLEEYRKSKRAAKLVAKTS